MIGSRRGGSMNKELTLDVNGKQHKVNVDPDMPLLYALRDDLGLNNLHFGCGRTAW
jgi:nicotinate dehydrogenase subunit A